jgi:two-component system response regulator PilR (NtrC family)
MASNHERVLVVDDEPVIVNSFVTILEKEGFECRAASTGEEAIDAVNAEEFDVVITDIRMPGKSGVDVMRHVKAKTPDTIVLLVTAQPSLQTAIEAVREGASDYVTKPVRFERLIRKIRDLLRIRDLEWENRILRIEKRSASKFDEIVGNTPAINEVKQAIIRVGQAGGNVFIEGESGTGKELVARAIHNASQDRKGAFVPVNCGSIPETLLESEFFGVKRGAFTGADSDKNGLFLQARGGTFFLDEVAELPMSLQPKLLRAIETKKIRALGATEAVSVDVRIIAATNKNLGELVKEKRFREDLFFRLNVFNIVVPPLRERVQDISVLANHFLDQYRSEIRSPAEKISPEAMLLLETYPWKGNARELQNVIQRALITATSSVMDVDIFEGLLGTRAQKNMNLKQALRNYEIFHIKRVLEEAGGSKQRAAELLGISLASLYSKLTD